MALSPDDLEPGEVLLRRYDRAAVLEALHVPTLRRRRLGAEFAHPGWISGSSQHHHGRLHAMFRWEGRLRYLYGRHVWDIEEALVSRRAPGVVRSLRFSAPDGTRIGACRYLDAEIANRWFIPKWLDITRDDDDAEDWDWSMWVAAVLLPPGRRDLIGRPS